MVKFPSKIEMNIILSFCLFFAYPNHGMSFFKFQILDNFFEITHNLKHNLQNVDKN